MKYRILSERPATDLSSRRPMLYTSYPVTDTITFPQSEGFPPERTKRLRLSLPEFRERWRRSMGTRARFSSQVSADGRFTELEVQRSLSDVTLAKTHAIGRNRRVGAVLCYLSLMKSRDLVPKGAKARAVGAEVQNFESEDGYEAAHYLPGQLKISVPGKGDIEPWSLVKNAATASEIASLFSAVQNLP